MHPFLKEMPNKEGKTAQVIFTEQHKDLLEKAEQWIKDTLNSCMLSLLSLLPYCLLLLLPCLEATMRILASQFS